MAKRNPKGKKNEPISRDHHHVGQAFLRGFGDAEGTISVYDFDTGKEFWTDPRAVAFERDFYMLDIPGMRPDALEKKLARIERASLALISRIETEKRLRTTDDFGQLLYFIALQALRGPDHRERMDRMVSAWRGRMEAIIRGVYREWFAHTPDAPPEDEWVAERLRRDASPLTRQDQINAMVIQLPGLVQALTDRCSVFTLLPDKPGFHLVSSDVPYTCVEYAGDDETGAETYRWVHWTHPAAQISMALSKHLFWRSLRQPGHGMIADLSDDTDPEEAARAKSFTMLQNVSTTLYARRVFGARPGPPDGINEPWPAPTKPG
jgi:hypothetical protein